MVSSKQLNLYMNCQEEFENTKEVIRIRKSKQDRQHNGQKKKDKRTNNSNDLHNTCTQKSKNRATRTPLNTIVNVMPNKI